ncbi:HpcH/HpaI aldolase family protein [Microbacterium sp. RD1]|uniref:HpcH/HpaI aldolase family protein n=1 Tax=Microbacterium sp. RD1 TaxID=3457313 RepID=UPI003FA593D4
MADRLNGLIATLERGDVAFGAWLQNGDFAAAQGAGDSSADFVFVDMEHTGFGFAELGHSLQWLLSRRTASRRPAPASPIVRTPVTADDRAPWVHKQTLDYGAMGLLLAQASRPDDVREVVQSMRYPRPGDDGPTGRRGALPGTAMRYLGIDSPEEYFARADLWPLSPRGELMLVLLVESVQAWENIDELVAVPGVGAVLWGPGDGLVSLGIHTFDVADPVLDPYRAAVVASCKAAGVPVGNPAATDLHRAIDEGFDFISTPDWDEPTIAAARAYARARRQS